MPYILISFAIFTASAPLSAAAAPSSLP